MFDGLADGVFKSEDAGTRFVDDGGRAVGEVRAGEVTSFEDVPADRGTKIGVHENVAEREGFCFLTHSFPFEYIILIKSVEVHGGVGDIGDHARVEQAIAKGLKMSIQFMRIIGNGDQSGLIIAQRLIFGKLDLTEYDDGADDQGERDGELGHDEDFARIAGAFAGFECPFQDFHRSEAGKIESRVAAGQQTGEQGTDQ